MSWNYRAVRRTIKGLTDEEEEVGVHEVYYDDDGNITKYTASPVAAAAETFEDLLVVITAMSSCVVLPVLDEKDLPGYRGD